MPSQFRWGAAVALAAMMVGCTAIQLRDDPGSAQEYRLKVPYEVAYRTFRDYARRCMVASHVLGGGMAMMVDADIMPEEGKAVVQVYVPAPFGPNHQARVEFARADAKSCVMTVKRPAPGVVDVGARYARIANSPETDDCPMN